MQKILIIEDDLNIGTALTGAIERQGTKVHYLTSGSKALEEFDNFSPDVVILDVNLNEKEDGFEIGRKIRYKSNVPIIFTTSREETVDLLEGFSIPNTDYIRKPYRMTEVLLRIQKFGYKEPQTKKETINISQYNFCPSEQLLQFNCEKIHLNNYETAVLTLLCRHRNAYITREELIKQVWGETQTGLKAASLNNTLSRLKKHLDKDKQLQIASVIKLGVKLEVKE